MSKKIGIVTIFGLYNFGNRLQNYAVQEILKILDYNPISLIRLEYKGKRTVKSVIKDLILCISKKGYIKQYRSDKKKTKHFEMFQKKIKSLDIKKENLNLLKDNYDYFAIGSDQVWNPYYMLQHDSDWYFLNFCESNKKIPIAPSIGINELPKEYHDLFKRNLLNFNNLSCREYEGAKIISNLTGKEVETVIDPTMMLTTEQWDKVVEQPKEYDNKRYVLLYFLGQLHEENKKLLEQLEKDGYEIINILDVNSKYYTSGPSEFVWLIKNASLMITDSFHGCVFSILYHTPFISFNRKGDLEMNSRINTLLKKFDFEDRMFDKDIDYEEVFNQDFSATENILNNERNKFMNFIKKCINE
ncbi:polysaccharide pyruvyl transferase family protein [Thomasclavelia sp.]|uniref:polysaccharide pyruvyl transferase family protein n=1 Tax=Thomasclavelia sp. TaxID=3025757 RepID=UPI00261141FB|nr:polysaccharide pyruvyl transferase family protein [Thomasclavelia sp.]